MKMMHENGSVFLYILIGIALMAGLSFVLTRAQNSQESTALTSGQVTASAQRLMTYANEASQAWQQMENTGADLGTLNLILPSAGAFDTAPNTAKFFHPDGGGFGYNAMNEDTFRAGSGAPVGWYFTLVNADFTATSGTDFLMTYIQLRKSLCEAINKGITGSTTIPIVTVDFADTFQNGSSALTEAACPECKTYPSICVQNGGVYAFYNLIAVR